MDRIDKIEDIGILSRQVCKEYKLGDYLDTKIIEIGYEDFNAMMNADFTDPMTAGIFVNIVAWASYQRIEDITPYWRTLKSDGELNVKYPEAIELQKRLLEEEGHTIISKGTKNIKYYVKDFEKSLIELYFNTQVMSILY